MTNKEAIANLKYIKETNILLDLHMGNEALDLAIRAMEAFESIDFNIYALGKLMEEYKNEIN